MSEQTDQTYFRFGTPHIDCGWLDVSVHVGNTVHHCGVSSLCEPYIDMVETLLGFDVYWDVGKTATVDWAGEPGGHCWVITRTGKNNLNVKLFHKEFGADPVDVRQVSIFDINLLWSDFAGQVFELGRQMLSLCGLVGYRQAWHEKGFPYTDWRELGDQLCLLQTPKRQNSLADDIACLQSLLGAQADLHKDRAPNDEK